MKYLKTILMVVTVTIILCSCSIVESNINSQFINGQGENSPGQTIEKDDNLIIESTVSNESKRNDEFIKMANHDNYIIGTIIDGQRTENYKDSYINITTKEEEYRIEGLCWDKNYTQVPFSIITTENLSSNYKAGGKIIVFYDAENINGNLIIPKDIYVSYEDIDIEERAEGIKKVSKRLIDNYQSISGKQVLTPEEAIITLIENKNFGPAEKSVDKYGSVCYKCGDYKVSYSGIIFSESFGMTDEEFIRYYEESHFEYPYFLESLNNDSLRRNEPYIKYRISVEKYDGETHIESEDNFYYVSINGKIE